MSQPKAVFTSPQGWTDFFMLACFLMAVVCIYGGVRKALAQPERRTQAVLKELLVFGFFVFMFWSLESYAHFRTPYYAYSTSFHDSIPRAHYFEKWIAHLPRLCDLCTDFVNGFVKAHGGTIPLSVVLLEASLTYAALWTAKLLKGPVGAQPIFAGLVLVTVDALLDPIVAMGHRCTGEMADPSPAGGNGLGLWHWYTPIPHDLVYHCPKVEAWHVCQAGISSGANTLAPYFHIPVFNYAAWLGAPIILVALVNLSGPIRREWIWPLLQTLYAWLRGRPSPNPPDITHRQVALLLSVLVPIVYIVYAAPAKDMSVNWQYAAILLALTTVVGIFVYNFGTFHTIDKVDATLVQPVAVGLAIPAFAALVKGQFAANPLLMPVAVVALAVGLWLAWLPYRDTLRKVSAWVGQADRFTRVHYFGFTTLLTLLGASYYSNDPSNLTLLGLLLVATCFHVFAYVSNDVFDLDLDKQNPLRQRDPLVTGAISVPTALALALTAIPVSVLATLLLVDFNVWASLRCLGILFVAYGLMTLYNWQGKRLKVPLFTDLAQGLAWGSLAFYGGMVAASADPKFDLADVIGRCWLLAAYGACFIFLINGIHGGLRDLRTDKANDRFTAAIVLGGKPDENDPKQEQVISTWKIAVFAHGVHLAMYGLVCYFLWLHSGADAALKHPWWGIGVAAVTFVISVAVLQGVVKPKSPDRNDWVSWGIFVLLLPPIAMFLLTEPYWTAFKVAVVLSFLVPLGLQEAHIDKLIRWVYEDDGLKGRLGQGLRAVLPKDKPAPMPAAALAGNVGGVDVETDPED